ncbi:hypothetical protein HMPREF9069_01828, partial [Atopobium sp. oral taxon 810 str. F0209]
MLLTFLLRVPLEPFADKRVLLEPVVTTFPQAVQNRTKRLKNAQIKISARAFIEPDVGERVHIEPDASKR